MSASLLAVEGLVVRYPVRRRGRRGVVHAVSGVSLHVARGETLGLVGESGCGKSTIARVVFGLTAADEGRVLFDGSELTGRSPRTLRGLRRRMGFVPQDPYGSLDPTLSVERSVAEPLRAHGMGNRAERLARARQLLRRVGLADADVARHPHALSGGQRQRVAIARALATAPELLVADEPVSALDGSIRARVLALLDEVRRERGLAMVLISHDLPIVRAVCDRLVVMYLGRVVEEGSATAIFETPAHPYTEELIAATLVADPEQRPAPVTRSAEPPSPFELLPGCAYAPRCGLADERCREQRPPLRSGRRSARGSGDASRPVACWKAAPGALTTRP